MLMDREPKGPLAGKTSVSQNAVDARYGRYERQPTSNATARDPIPTASAVEETPVSDATPMPNELVNEAGEVLYSNRFTMSLGETLADFEIHVQNVASLSTRVPVHRALVREISEVLTDPRIVKAKQFATLGQQADALAATSKRAGRLAFLRPGHLERQHEIASRRNQQLTLLGRIGTGEDPILLARRASELAALKDRVALRCMNLRTAQVLSEVNAQPEYLRELIGPRPDGRNLRINNLWQTAAEKIVAAGIDLGITAETVLGLNLGQDRALARTVSSARQALGLDTPDWSVYAGIGF
jgi:hypothetical protein